MFIVVVGFPNPVIIMWREDPETRGWIVEIRRELPNGGGAQYMNFEDRIFVASTWNGDVYKCWGCSCGDHDWQGVCK